MAASDVPETFRALRVELEGERVRRSIAELETGSLPDHPVTVRVAYSSLNYKDALSASGNRGVTRTYPHTPGIDAAGTVLTSRDPRFAPGDRVLCTGFDLGMDTPGGFGELIRVPGDWLVPLPEGLDEREAMVLGTAGLTAAIGLELLQRVGASPELGPYVVTGASGGVGTLAVALLARAGYRVVASTGTDRARRLLGHLGAEDVLDRAVLGTPTQRPMLKGLYGGGIDTVGGDTLAGLLKQTVVGGAVAACGMVGGAELNVSVFPFILRGVALLGIDSQHYAMERRQALWRRMAGAWRIEGLADIPGLVTEVDLDGIEPAIEDILVGATVGRVVVRLAS
jgi:acrylyl-CoA reductase (NADPH)